MTVPPSAPKLGKLIALLSSDKDGERLAAVDAIGRALQSSALDFHDLARAVDRIEIRPPTSAPVPLFQLPPRWENLSEFDGAVWLQTLLRADWLTDDDQYFLTYCEQILHLHCSLHGYEVWRMNRLIATATAKGVEL